MHLSSLKNLPTDLFPCGPRQDALPYCISRICSFPNLSASPLNGVGCDGHQAIRKIFHRSILSILFGCRGVFSPNTLTLSDSANVGYDGRL